MLLATVGLGGVWQLLSPQVNNKHVLAQKSAGAPAGDLSGVLAPQRALTQAPSPRRRMTAQRRSVHANTNGALSLQAQSGCKVTLVTPHFIAYVARPR